MIIVVNSSFVSRGKAIHLIDLGEASCLGLSKILSEKNIVNASCVDERTLRMLVEDSRNMKKFFERKFHTSIQVKRENFDYFKQFKIIRSTELVYMMWKKGIIKVGKAGDKELLDALLWAVKFKGCSINDAEIAGIERIG